MEFRKYSSIENSYQEKFIQSIAMQGHGNMEYIVQEKVHGANLSFITNGKEILTAKRTEILAETDEFYNVRYVREKYEKQLFALFNDLAAQFGAATITIFGELFGGVYPHKDVAKDKLAKTVQKGVFYTPSNDFLAFDILVDTGNYLAPELVAELLEKHGFVYAKTLFKGSLQACLEYPNEFITTIPAMYGLPEIEGNYSEGVIIRPVETTFMRTGPRLIIKNKSEKWAEKKNKGTKVQVEEPLSEQALLLCGEASRFITENRLHNVVSKIGEVTIQDFGKVLGMLSKDILEDFLKENQEAYDQLEKNEMKAVNKFINKQAQRMVLVYLSNQ